MYKTCMKANVNYPLCVTQFYMSTQMHFVFLFCGEQAGQALMFNFMTLFGMKLPLCFCLLRPDRGIFFSWIKLADVHTQTSPKSQNQMQMEMQFKDDAGRICNGLD